MDTLKESGDFEAETNTRSDATGEVLRLIVDEFWRLQRERVGERELDDAKAYLTGSFPLTIETPEAIAMQVLNALFYGLPLEELQNFRERVNAVTVDDIQRVARCTCSPTRCRSCWSATRRRSRRSCAASASGTYETVELGDLDLSTANFKRAERPGWRGRTCGRVRPVPARSGRFLPLASRPARVRKPPATGPTRRGGGRARRRRRCSIR